MGLMWTGVGLIAGLSVFAYVELTKRYRLDWRSWSLLVLGEVMLLFAIAWTVAAIAEGVPRSASLGAMLFGGGGLVVLLLAWRFFVAPEKFEQRETEVVAEAPPASAVTSDEESSRRSFLGGIVSAVGVPRLVAGGALIGGAGAATYAAIRVRGTPHDELPIPIRDDYKPVDQRNMIWTFAASKKLSEAHPRRTKFKGLNFHERLKTYNKTWREDVGHTQLDRALAWAAWSANDALARDHQFGRPNQGVFGWDQSDVSETKYAFKSPEEAALVIKSAARAFHAERCGITPRDLRFDYQPLYDAMEEKVLTWEDDFPFEPKSVIVMIMEMDYEGIAASPTSVSASASAEAYSSVCKMVGQMAAFLRKLGYKAVGAQNDLGLSGAYAVAAGLGETGRNGNLIAPTLGPRVRIGKIYTDLEPVAYDKPRSYGITSFCINCKRCADSCPSGAISQDDDRAFGPTYEGSEDPDYAWNSNPGVLKWHNDMKKCLSFWMDQDQECSNCITSCPYNKPDFWHHRFVDGMNVLSPGPVHALMREMDIWFGYGETFSDEAVEKFWTLGKNMRGG